MFHLEMWSRYYTLASMYGFTRQYSVFGPWQAIGPGEYRSKGMTYLETQTLRDSMLREWPKLIIEVRKIQFDSDPFVT